MKASEVAELIGKDVLGLEVMSERRVKAETDKERYLKVLRDLRERNIQHVTTISGVDLGELIEVTYHIDCGNGTLLSLKLRLDGRAPVLYTVTDIFPGAILYERELMDMFGVKVEGHPDPRRIFLPEDWHAGEYPLRKEVGK